MYKLDGIQRRDTRVLYKLNYASIVSISASITICYCYTLCITYKDIHLGFSEYLVQYIIIQSPNHRAGENLSY